MKQVLREIATFFAARLSQLCCHSQFIGEAVKRANERAGEPPTDADEKDRMAYSAKWNFAFATAMDKLSAPAAKAIRQLRVVKPAV